MEAQFLSGELLSNPHFLREQKRKNKEPKTCLDFGYELLKVTPEL
jgi:hypothetical protein